MTNSLWSDNIKLPSLKKMEGVKKTDVLIIGGGICGILCAYFLKQSGIDYMLVEGKRITSGITQNTTAKITLLHGLIYDKIIREYGKEFAEKYLSANISALKKYAELSKNIDCDFETKPAYTYTIKDRDKIEREVNALNSLGYSAKFVAETKLPFNVAGAVCVENQAQFNPLRFIAEIAKELNIYEDTFVKKIEGNQVVCDSCRIIAKKVIVATHFPFLNKHGSYFLKLYQHRSYVLALENAEILDGMYVDEDNKGLSFRNYGNILLLGGGGHRTGKPGGSWNELEKFRKNYYFNSKVVNQWATQDCMSLDSIPYIGHYSAKTPDLYVATGFNKWGMTTSMIAAQLLCDLVQEKKNDFSDVFSPSRSILKTQLFLNGIETLSNFVFPTTKRCPHLGCALKWNKAEHSWDCPCHGSRFEENGKLIDNPATKNAEI